MHYGFDWIRKILNIISRLSCIKNGGKNIQTKFELNDVLSGLYVDDGLLAILRVFVEKTRKKARISSHPYPEARRYALTKSATYVYRLVLDSLSYRSFAKDWWSKDNIWWIIVIRAFYLIKNHNYRRVIHHRNKKPAPLQFYYFQSIVLMFV